MLVIGRLLKKLEKHTIGFSVLTLWFCLFLAITCSGKTLGRKQLNESMLTSVSFYSWGLNTSKTSINFTNNQLYWFGTRLSSDGKTQWCTMKSKVKEHDANQVLALINKSKLREFRPNEKQFSKRKPAYVPKDGGAYIRLVWTDQEVCFAIPPDDIVTSLPAGMRKHYKIIDNIDIAVLSLKKKYSKSTSCVPVADFRQSMDYKNLLEDLALCDKTSIPKNRQGW